jgi:photosystem II stability/assembly factor-like uncharacterized protein
MKRGTALAAALIFVITGCGTQVLKASSPTVTAAPAPLATSLTTAQGTWAIAVMGGSSADEDNFWQLFVRPAASATWKLVTPPAVADNGGLVAAGSAASLLIGFRPSQDLTFSPLATSTSTGKNWAAGLLNADLASAPDALATAASGQELALLGNGTIESSSDAGVTWSRLPALVTSAAGRSCQLVAVNAVSFWTDETPVAAGNCTRTGVAGVFRDTAGTWEQDGPSLPAAYAHDQVGVLRLTAFGSDGTAALLQAGSDLLATWTSGTTWASPVALPVAAGVRATGFGADGSAWVLLDDGDAYTIAGPGQAWVTLPRVPAQTAVLAPGTDYDALATSGSKLTVWQLSSGTWTKIQSISVPIEYGSSS